MKLSLQTALYLLMLLCTLQMLLVFYLIQITKNGEGSGLSDILKAVQSQNHLLQKRLAPPPIKRRDRLSLAPHSMGSTLDDNLTAKLKDERKSVCDVVDVAIVCAGSASVRNVQPLLKSLLFYRRRNHIQLHLIVDRVSEHIFHRLLSTWDIPSLTYFFYRTEALQHKVQWIPNLHYSGVFGLMKLLLVDALPQQLHKVIVLDTDITCNSDIAELWNYFGKFTSNQVLGLVDNQSNWYLRSNHWPALGRGFNTGVILMDLDGLRALNWTQLWTNITLSILPLKQTVHLADQDIVNAVLKSYPELVHALPCEWNVQLNENALSEWCYLREDSVPMIIHWNSPKKDKLSNRNSDTFRQTYLAFVEYDGGLLKKEIFNCQQQWTMAKVNRTIRDNCADMKQAGNNVYRTHLYYLNFQHLVINSSDVTFVTQLSIDRILMLETIATQWPGPMSVAIYANDAEAITLVDFVSASSVLRRRTNIGYHVVYKQGTNVQALYPVNFLRNVAMDEVQTDFQLLSDVDFVPKVKLGEYLAQIIKSQDNFTLETKVAFVVPAFETTLHRFILPIYKKLLLILWDRNLVYPFRFGMWKAGQVTVNYSRWRNAVEPYEVEWTPYFEPYVLISKLAPRFDTRFVGFGWNKVSYTITLNYEGYQLLVVPDAFLVHLPHSPSISNNKFRLDYRYRRSVIGIEV